MPQLRTVQPKIYLSQIVANWLTLPFCIQEITGSNLGVETGYSDDIFMKYPSHFRQICNMTLKKSMYTCFMSLQIQKSSFHSKCHNIRSSIIQ